MNYLRVVLLYCMEKFISLTNEEESNLSNVIDLDHVQEMIDFMRLDPEDSDFMELVEYLTSDIEDFNFDGYRFIHDSSIDEILVDELSNDPYMLGCWNNFVYSQVLDCPPEVATALQAGEQYEALGQWCMDQNVVEDMAEILVSHNGYGHHFNVYDGSDNEIGHYHVFRVN